MTMLSKETTGMPFTGLPEWAVTSLDKVVARTTRMSRKLDAVIIYTGEEGSGKSTLMTQHAYYVAKHANTQFDLSNYSFTPTQFIEGIHEGRPRGTPMVYDEAINGLMAVMGKSIKGIKLQITFGTCRSKQYPIFLAAPRIYQLPYWMVYDRALGMFETRIKWDDQKELQGVNQYRGFPRTTLRIYYSSLKEKWREKPKLFTTEWDTFTGWPFSKENSELPFTTSQYEKAKQKALKEEDTSDVRKSKAEIGVGKWIEYLHLNLGMSYAEIGKIGDMSERHARRLGEGV